MQMQHREELEEMRVATINEVKTQQKTQPNDVILSEVLKACEEMINRPQISSSDIEAVITFIKRNSNQDGFQSASTFEQKRNSVVPTLKLEQIGQPLPQIRPQIAQNQALHIQQLVSPTQKQFSQIGSPKDSNHSQSLNRAVFNKQMQLYFFYLLNMFQLYSENSMYGMFSSIEKSRCDESFMHNSHGGPAQIKPPNINNRTKPITLLQKNMYPQVQNQLTHLRPKNNRNHNQVDTQVFKNQISNLFLSRPTDGYSESGVGGIMHLSRSKSSNPNIRVDDGPPPNWSALHDSDQSSIMPGGNTSVLNFKDQTSIIINKEKSGFGLMSPIKGYSAIDGTNPNFSLEGMSNTANQILHEDQDRSQQQMNNEYPPDDSIIDQLERLTTKEYQQVQVPQIDAREYIDGALEAQLNQDLNDIQVQSIAEIKRDHKQNERNKKMNDDIMVYENLESSPNLRNAQRHLNTNKQVVLDQFENPSLVSIMDIQDTATKSPFLQSLNHLSKKAADKPNNQYLQQQEPVQQLTAKQKRNQIKYSSLNGILNGMVQFGGVADDRGSMRQGFKSNDRQNNFIEVNNQVIIVQNSTIGHKRDEINMTQLQKNIGAQHFEALQVDRPFSEIRKLKQHKHSGSMKSSINDAYMLGITKPREVEQNQNIHSSMQSHQNYNQFLNNGNFNQSIQQHDINWTNNANEEDSFSQEGDRNPRSTLAKNSINRKLQNFSVLEPYHRPQLQNQAMPQLQANGVLAHQIKRPSTTVASLSNFNNFHMRQAQKQSETVPSPYLQVNQQLANSLRNDRIQSSQSHYTQILAQNSHNNSGRQFINAKLRLSSNEYSLDPQVRNGQQHIIISSTNQVALKEKGVRVIKKNRILKTVNQAISSQSIRHDGRDLSVEHIHPNAQEQGAPQVFKKRR